MVSNKVSLQNQLQNPALVTLNNLMRPLTARLEDDYYSITVANHRLINVIRFVAKNYTISKNFINRLHLVLMRTFVFLCKFDLTCNQTRPYLRLFIEQSLALTEC